MDTSRLNREKELQILQVLALLQQWSKLQESLPTSQLLDKSQQKEFGNQRRKTIPRERIRKMCQKSLTKDLYLRIMMLMTV